MYGLKTGVNAEKRIKARRKFVCFLFIVFSLLCLISACGVDKNPNGKEETKNGDISVEESSSSNNESSDKNSAEAEETETEEDSGKWTSVHLPE
ncbi:MAG: hypothetical protein ACI4SH_00040 [Candidatus Scatosoma sp.]